MKNVLVLLMILAVASLASATALPWATDFEAGQLNVGSTAAGYPTANTTQYPTALSTFGSGSTATSAYGWVSAAYNVTDTRSYGQFTTAAAENGSQSLKAMSRNIRTDLGVNLLAGKTYTFTVKWMIDATTDFDPGAGGGWSQTQERIYARLITGTGNGTGSTYFADDHLEGQTGTVYATNATYGVWNTATISWNQLTDAANTRIRLSAQFGDAYNNTVGDVYNGGAYVDSMTFTETPEPATMALLGLGSLALVRRKRA